MSRKCEICGKATTFGHTISRRGLAKYKGGVGRKITGKTNRRFKANVQKIHAVVNGAKRRIKVCAQCIRAGKVTRSV